METGEQVTKQAARSARHRGHSKVRLLQKVPDTEKMAEGDVNAFYSHVNTNWGMFEKWLFSSLQNPFHPQSQREH